MPKKLLVVANPFNIAVNYFHAKKPAPDSLLVFLNKLIASCTQCLLPPATECGKEMFSVVSVCLPVHREETYDHTQTCSNLFSCTPSPVPTWRHLELPPDLFKLVCLGAPALASTPTHLGMILACPLPKPVRTCSLCSLYIYQQVGG